MSGKIFFAILLTVLAAAATLDSCVAKAEGLYLTASAISFHTERHQGYNEHDNLGLGLEKALTENVRLGAGWYKNSFYKHTNYAYVMYTPYRLGEFHLGTVAGVLTGYHSYPIPAIIPVATWERHGYGINLLALPPIPGAAGVFSIQFKKEL